MRRLLLQLNVKRDGTSVQGSEPRGHGGPHPYRSLPPRQRPAAPPPMKTIKKTAFVGAPTHYTELPCLEWCRFSLGASVPRPVARWCNPLD